jgi:GNAT superfamily N-acetyltransferase
MNLAKSSSASRARLATVADAESIAAVHASAWRSAYHALLPPAVLDQVDAATRIGQWRAHIESGARDVLVAVTEEEIVGFCSLAPSRDAGALAACGEITALYVHPSSWRRGHGRVLLAAAREHAASRGWKELTLWVLSSNAPAREFYASRGFEHDGAVKNEDQPALAEARYRFRVAGE